MDNSRFLDSVLRPITTFLEQALGRRGIYGDLKETAEPLILAIEAVPGSGRVAIFVDETTEIPRFVAGPSFSSDEVNALSGVIASAFNRSNPEDGFESHLIAGAGRPNKVRLFLLKVPGEQPNAILVTVRDLDEHEKNPVFDGFMDQIVQLAGIVVEDKRLRSRIADQQSVLEALLSAAPDAIIRIDRSGIILDFLGSAPRIFGWPPDEIIGQPVAALMPNPHASLHDNYIDAFLATGERKLPDFGRRLQARHKSGAVFPVEIALSQIHGHSDVEFIGIIRDISRRVERESEIDAMREALDAASLQSALGEFAATIAHELNQPLTAIANYMDALELRLATPSEDNVSIAMELARKTAAQARLGGEIIRRTRRMALHSESEMAMESFHAAIAEAISIIGKAPAASDVSVRLNTFGDDKKSLIDRVQIQQVVVNLVSNALRAVQASETKIVSIVSRQLDDRLELVVSDTGSGIPDDDKPKIFNRFFRRSENGMGLGLAVVRRIAAAHGGDVHVGDSPDGGAEFTLTIPRRVI